MEKKVTTAGLPINKLPKVRLSEGIEFLEETLDSTLTAHSSCDQDMCAIIVWLLTRIRPNLMITDLRCERYIDLYLRFRAASNRFKAHNAHDYNEVLSKLVMSELEPEPVLDMAITRGFKQLWLEKKKTTNQVGEMWLSF